MHIQESKRKGNSNSMIFPTKPSSADAAHLQQLGYKFLDILCNTRDLNNPFIRKHVAEDFSNKHDFEPNGSIEYAREVHLKRWQKVLADMPDFYMDCVDVSPDIDKSGLKARVWCWKREGGFPGAFNRESVSVQNWELRDGTWVCYQMKTLLGVVGF